MSRRKCRRHFATLSASRPIVYNKACRQRLPAHPLHGQVGTALTLRGVLGTLDHHRVASVLGSCLKEVGGCLGTSMRWEASCPTCSVSSTTTRHQLHGRSLHKVLRTEAEPANLLDTQVKNCRGSLETPREYYP